MLRATIFFVLTISLLGCGVSAPNPTPVPSPISVVGAPSPGVTLPATAAALSQTPIPPAVSPPPATFGPPTAGPQAVSPERPPAFSDQTLGLSFSYPPDWSLLTRTPDDPPGVTLHGPSLGQGPEPIIFAITVDVEAVSEKSVRQIVDEQLAQVPADLAVGIDRTVITVGGEPAEKVIGLPSRGGALETFVIHDNRLFLVILQPYDQANESLTPYLGQVRLQYESLLSSWKFLK